MLCHTYSLTFLKCNNELHFLNYFSSLALTGGSRIFFRSPPSLPYFSCLPLFVSSHLNCLGPLCTATLSSRSATSAVINAAGPDGCLPELDMFPPVAMLCVYGICAFVLRCFFLFSHCTPQWSIVWGLKQMFSSLSSCNAVFFFNSLSSCSVYPVVICMLCMYGQVDGLFHWYL